MIKNIIFDFDGTLVDSNEAVIDSLKETHKKYFGAYPDDKTVSNTLGKPLETQLRELGIEENIDEALQYYRDYYRMVRDEKTYEYDGIVHLLNVLYDMEINMIIVSNKGRNGLSHGLKKFEYEKFFKLVIGKDDVLFNKPDRHAFDIIRSKLGGEEEHYLMVGDSVSDIKFGKNCSLKTVLVSWTLVPMEGFSGDKPDFIINEPMDLLKIINRLNQ